MEMMRAMTIERYKGGRDATRITDVPYPKCGPKHIIIKVMASCPGVRHITLDVL